MDPPQNMHETDDERPHANDVSYLWFPVQCLEKLDPLVYISQLDKNNKRGMYDSRIQ